MAKTNDHDHVPELLDLYRTGELGEPERLRVERHLEACEACRGELEALEAFARTVERGYAAERVARAAEREPDWARLRASVVARTSARAPGARRARLGRYVPQAALAVLALVALGVLWEQGVRGPGEADRALRSERQAGQPEAAVERPRGPEAPPGTARDDGAAAEGRFAEAPGLTETIAPVAPSSPDEADGRREAVLEDGRFRGDLDAVGGEAERAGADTPGVAVENRAEVSAQAEVVQKREAAADEAGRAPAEPGLHEEVGKAAAAPPADLERFHRDARSALFQADTLLAAKALAQWRDSLARRDLPPELERTARALADSLAAFLANRP